MLGHALAITWPIWFALKWRKKKSPSLIPRLLSCDLFCIPFFLHHPSYMLLEMVAEVYFFLSLPGFQVILTFHICNNKKKKRRKFIIVLFKWTGRGEIKFNVLLYKSHDGCLRWKKSNVSQFVNFGTRWPLEIQQYTEFTSKSSTCKWPGTVSPLD